MTSCPLLIRWNKRSHTWDVALAICGQVSWSTTLLHIACRGWTTYSHSIAQYLTCCPFGSLLNLWKNCSLTSVQIIIVISVLFSLTASRWSLKYWIANSTVEAKPYLQEELKDPVCCINTERRHDMLSCTINKHWVRLLGPIQINSGRNVLAELQRGPQSEVAPPDQIRTGAARPINQSEQLISQTRDEKQWVGAALNRTFGLWSFSVACF